VVNPNHIPNHKKEAGNTVDATASVMSRFDDQDLKPTACTIATAVRKAEVIELRFGCLEARAPGSVGATMTHRVRFDLAAARYLEEALTRLLGSLEAAAQTDVLKS
jgi:hypothetical protein